MKPLDDYLSQFTIGPETAGFEDEEERQYFIDLCRRLNLRNKAHYELTGKVRRIGEDCNEECCK